MMPGWLIGMAFGTLFIQEDPVPLEIWAQVMSHWVWLDAISDLMTV